LALVSSQSQITIKKRQFNKYYSKVAVLKDTVKKTKVVVLLQEIKKDTVADKMGELVLHKKNAHASYYADKFHGRRASGTI
jgi:rare lipoprotein A